jgi:cell division transport system ATP-binding protein
MILLDRVTKVYSKDAKPALNRISLHVEPREFVILVGTSGAGKSTLLKLLTCEERPSSGKIVVGGIDYDDLKDKQVPILRRKIGVVFQDFKLLPQRTVFENISFALEIAGMTSQEIKSTVPKVIKLVGLEGKEKQFPRQLSGGEQQRVAIARALVMEPKYLFADEPTGNLDSSNGTAVMNLLKKINRDRKMAVLFVTHDSDFAKMASRQIKMADGIVLNGS